MNQGQDQIQTIPLEQPRPTFADFIKWAILRSPRQRATAEEICEAVSARYPFYQDPVQFKFLKAGVKHRTSRLPQFKLTGAKPAGQTAKGNYWIYVAELDRSAKRSPLDPFNDMSGSLTLMAGPTATTEGDTGIDTGTSTQGLTSILEAALASVSLEAPLASASLSENIPGCPGNRDCGSMGVLRTEGEEEITRYFDLDGASSHPPGPTREYSRLMIQAYTYMSDIHALDA